MLRFALAFEKNIDVLEVLRLFIPYLLHLGSEEAEFFPSKRFSGR